MSENAGSATHLGDCNTRNDKKASTNKGRKKKNKNKSSFDRYPRDQWVWSPAGSVWNSDLKDRQVVGKTSRRICTLVLPYLYSNNNSKVSEQDEENLSVISEKFELPSSGQSVASYSSFCTKGSSGTFSDTATKQKKNSSFRIDDVRVGLACPPLIAFGKYVLAATTDARVCIYSLVDYSDDDDHYYDNVKTNDNLDDQDVVDWESIHAHHDQMLEKQEEINQGLSPQVIVGPFSIRDEYSHDRSEFTSTIVAMATTKTSNQCFVGVLMAEGDLVMLEFTKSSNSKNNPIVKTANSISTFELGATCLCFHSSNGNSHKSKTLRVAIGYESGEIIDMELKLSVPLVKTNKKIRVQKTDYSNKTQLTCSKRIKWKGHLTSPIRSIASMKANDTILTVGVEAQNPASKNFSDLVEVIHISNVENEYTKKYNHKMEQLDPTNTYSMPLDSFCLWPEAGKEIQDVMNNEIASFLVGQSYEQISGVDNKFHSTNQICSFTENNNTVGVAISTTNGTIAILHPHLSEDDNGGISWGVVDSLNQLVLPQPCIGLSVFDSTTVDGHNSNIFKHRDSIAFCLRGGTIFVSSRVKPDNLKLNSSDSYCSKITMYTYPSDSIGDEDSIIRFLHSFAAGYIQVDKWSGRNAESINQQSSSKYDKVQPVLLRALQGGMIDVHSCNLFEFSDHEPEVRENNMSLYNDSTAVFVEILKNGAAFSLYQFLLSLDEKDEGQSLLLDKPLWKMAREECRRMHLDLKVTTNDILFKTISGRGTGEFESFLTILKSFMQDQDDS